MKTFLVYFPLFVWFLTYVFFVQRVVKRALPRLILGVLTLACAVKFLVFREFYGHPFAPVAPELMIWVWNWAYSGMMLLCPLAIIARIFCFYGGILWILPIIAWGLSARGLYNGVRIPIVSERVLSYDELPDDLDGYRIVHLSDIHTSSAATKWRTEAIVTEVNSLDADLIVVTGDIVDGLPEDQSANIAPIRHLKAKDGVYFITGNHEFYNHYFTNWKPLFDDWGLNFVDDRCVMVRPSLAVAGRYDMRGVDIAHIPPAPAKVLFSEVGEGVFRLLLDHQPKRVLENLREAQFDLQLSGHTHGGVMPGLRQLVRWWNGGFYRGVYEFIDKKLYVSPGTGQWAGFPMRFFNDAEITVLRLRKRKL